MSPRKSAKATPRASVVIPVHEHAALTHRCLETLLAQELPATEIVVVDDGSRDGTAALLAGYGERIVVVRQDANSGFAAASNAGARAASGELLLFLNNDTIPIEGWLDALLAAADDHPEAAAFGAKLLWPDNVVQHAGVVIAQGGLPHHIYAGFPSGHPAVNAAREMPAVTAACMLVRRAAFEAAGGFDESYLNGYEDVDLCLRLRQAGGAVRYCPEAVVYHLESATRGRSAAEGEDPNLALLRERWRGELRADDIDHYLADGLLQLHYNGGQHPIGVQVDPALASAVAEGADNTLPWLLNTRSQQVFELLRDIGREGPTTPRGPVVFRADGARVEDAPVPEDRISAEALHAVDFLESKIAPMRLAIDENEPERVDILVPSLDTGHFFGGYITVVHLIRRLRERHRVRIVTPDDPLAEGAEEARRKIERFQGLAGTLAGVEIVSVADRSHALPVNPRNRFIAMTSFTAHLAHHATRELGLPRFLNIIQEQDGLTLPNGAFQAVAEQSYDFPQVAVFSSELLREHFAKHGRGLFAAGREAGERDSLSFQNAITDVGDVTADELRAGAGNRLLLYARPQATEARNMFELAVLALRTAVARKALPAELEFIGVGRGGTERGAIPLHGDTWLEMIPRQPLGRYRGLLRAHDIGLSLMHTPHPSLVPLEMASAGMPVVTTTYDNKTAAALAELSPNIIGVAPNVDAIVAGLQLAIERLDDFTTRAAGARVAWSRSWDETFDEAAMAGIERLLARCLDGA